MAFRMDLKERRTRSRWAGPLRGAVLVALFGFGTLGPGCETCNGAERTSVAMRSGRPSQYQGSVSSLPQEYVASETEQLALRRRVDERLRYALTLAARGAVCSARAEFIKAIDLVAMSLDVQEGGAAHRRALQAGLQAFQEAADFRPAGTSPEISGDLTVIIAAHRTPVLKSADPARVLPTAAMQAYFAYATEQFALAGGHEPAASLGFYSWARVEAMPTATEARVANKLSEPTAIALQRAALAVDANNFLAANELGVLLARYGRMEEAKQVLQQSVATSGRPETWHNLAIVHQNLGEATAAQQAYAQYQVAAGGRREAPAKAPQAAGAAIRWVDYESFVRDSGPDEMSMLNPRKPANTSAVSKIGPSENPLGFLSGLAKPKATAEAAPAHGASGPEATAERPSTEQSSNPRKPSAWSWQRSSSP